MGMDLEIMPNQERHGIILGVLAGLGMAVVAVVAVVQ
jgi:hypothetical protein